MVKNEVQPWTKRREIPDPQVKDAASQFERVRQSLASMPPGSGVVLPLLNVSAIAIELYLKCLSAEKIYDPDDYSEGSVVYAKPERGHGLLILFDAIPGSIKEEMARKFKERFGNEGNFNNLLEQCEGAFESSRYPFEKGMDISECFRPLMECSEFLSKFVEGLETSEKIEFQEDEGEKASPKEVAKSVRKELARALKKEILFVNELIDYALELLRRCEGSELANSSKYSFHISLIMFVRSYNSSMAMRELLKTGFALQAAMICRSLFDDMVNLKYLNTGDCEANANRYLEFRKLRTARSIQRYQGLQGEKNTSKVLKEHLEETKRLFREKFPTGSWDKDWSGYSEREKAEKTGLLQHYIVVSKQLSNIIHGAPEGIDAGVKGKVLDKNQFWIGPSTNMTLEVLSIHTQYLLLSVEEMVRKFELEDQRDKVSALGVKWRELFTSSGRKNLSS